MTISTSSNLWMKCTSTQEVSFFTKMTSLTTTKEFRTRKYAISPIGVAAHVVSHSSLQAASMSATVLVGLDPHRPLIMDLREQSNTSQDFCTFLTLAVEMGFFSRGDTLVYDNAAVHFAMDTWEEVRSLLDTSGVSSIPLPTYSPELNPVEKCFGVVKHHLRYCRQPREPLLLEILKGFAKITPSIVAAEYTSCLNTCVSPFLTPPAMEWFEDS